jgi:hypothetical protein
MILLDFKSVLVHQEDGKMYSFEISDISELDLDRIIQENVEAGVHAVIVPCKNDDLLLISNEFLAQFQPGDYILVDGNALQPAWGHDRIGVYYKDDKLSLHWRADSQVGVTLGRATRINSKNRERVAQQIRAAMDYERKIKVEVLQLHSKAQFT